MLAPARAGLRLFASAVLVSLAVRGADGAAAGGVRVERVSGDPLTAQRLTAIDAQSVVLQGEGGEVRVPFADVIEIGFATTPDPPQAWGPRDVAVDLWSGEVLHGEIRGGDAKGITLASPVLGNVKVALDRLAGLRFLLRLSLMPEPPDLRPSPDHDVIHLVGGDLVRGTIESFSEKAVNFESTTKEKLLVDYEKMTALRVIADVARRPKGTLLVAVLRDGSQVMGVEPEVKESRLRMKGVSGFAVDAVLGDVVAAHVISDRFAYLSDLPAKVEVQPFWKSVAGDPSVLYAPRTDRSFSGRALTSGGKTWVKGIGVYSGTSLTWTLDGNFSEFRGAVGVDDGAGPLGGVVFEVLVDGKPKWTSGFVQGAGVAGRGKKSPVDVPRIDVKGAKTLTLRVLSGDTDDPWPIADEADWLGAMLVKS